jgi:PAS domain S-box-containing protein
VNTSALHLLHLEDDPAAARLIAETLRAEGLAADITVVSSRPAYIAALEHGDFDLVLADYRVPGFDGLEALALWRAQPHAKAFVFVTGAMGEEQAIASLKSGATDYVLKENLARLVPAIRHAVVEGEERARRQKAEEALRQSEGRLATAMEQARLSYWEMDAASKVFTFNDRFYALYGTTAEREGGYQMPADVYAREFLSAEDQPSVPNGISQLLSGEIPEFQAEHPIRRRDGELRHIFVRVTVVRDAAGRIVGTRGTNQDITVRKRLEAERELTLRLLDRINSIANVRELMVAVTQLLREATGCEAVGIRLKEGEDFPYFETSGFPAAFVEAENQLCAKDQRGELLRDSQGNPVLECMCGNVLCGRFDPAKPFFTARGSFWSNGTTQLLASTTDAARQARTRNRCNGEGYESVALIRIRTGGGTFGLLQFNDKRPGRFTLDRIGFLERLADHLGSALARWQAQEALRNNQALLTATLETTADGMLVVDGAEKVVSFNRHFVGLWRIPEILISTRDERRLLQFVLDQLRYPEAFVKTIESLRQTPEATVLDELEFKDGRVFERYSQPQRMGEVIVGRVWSFRDITQRKRAEEALRENEEKYRNIFESSRDAFMILAPPTWRFTAANPATVEMFGAKNEEEIKANEPWKLSPVRQPDGRLSAEKAREMIDAAMREGSQFFEWTHRRLGGEEFLANVLLSRMQSAGKVFLQATVRDVTERRQAEEQLRQQAALLDAASDAIYLKAMDDTVRYWNQGAERMYGWTRAEALGRLAADLMKLDAATYEIGRAQLLQQGKWTGEVKKWTRAGKELVVLCRWTLLRNEEGQPRQILAINTDITEQKRMEAQFLRAQRLEGIGALASGIAHDLNNILAPILMTAPLLSDVVKDPDDLAMIDTIESCAKRGADIISQLLTFARGKPGVRVPLPLRHLLNDMNKIIGETFPKDIQATVATPEDLWTLMGDATQLHQVLMNLCVNARDAMPDGGALTLRAKNVMVGEAFAARTPDARPGPFVCVSVTDTGTGIPAEHLERVFDPFFTTKEAGKGTGLGLATVLGIVRGHDGFLRVESQLGQGTTFEVYFPALLQAQAAKMVVQKAPLPHGQGELILVVDDEVNLRKGLRRTLETYGYQVLLAAEGAEGIAVFTRHRAEIRAVLTDMVMPVMSGTSMITALRAMEPEVIILGMTGMAERAGVKGLANIELPVLLTKPFTGGELLRVLHAVLHPPLAAAAPKDAS